MGSSLPPAELARQDSALFEKMKYIFSIAPVGNFGEVAGVFLAEKTLTGRWLLEHRTLRLSVRCRDLALVCLVIISTRFVG